MFFTLFGDWVCWGGGAPTGVVHNLLMRFFALYSKLRSTIPKNGLMKIRTLISPTSANHKKPKTLHHHPT